MGSNSTRKSPATSLQWELLVAMRLFDIVFLFLAPILWTGFNLEYLPPAQIIILGGIAFLLYIFVVRERRVKSTRFVRSSLIVLGVGSAVILLNFFMGIILNLVTGSISGIGLDAIICMTSIVFFYLVVRYKPFQSINNRVTNWVQAWQTKAGRNRWIKRHYLSTAGIAWICISMGILWVPYVTYVQNPPTTSSAFTPRLGFWTSTSPLDPDRNSSSSYITNETLELFAGSGVYFVLGCRFYSPYTDALQVLNRCRDFGVEVNIYFCPKTPGDAFTNIWTFERLSVEMDEFLSVLNESNLLGNPVTTLVYDMEGLPNELHFPFYITNATIKVQLADYYEIQEQFVTFNRHVREDYHLGIRICTDWFQRVDNSDGDDDLAFLNGVMGDPSANWSYMAYRKNFLAYNFLLDHCKFLANGDTIILNSWKDKECFCYGDINCLIDECRFVLGYTSKQLNLEFWTLSNFLPSYGVSGMIQLVQALRAPPSTWGPVVVQNSWPYSPYWDMALYGVSLLDLYGPLFRILML